MYFPPKRKLYLTDNSVLSQFDIGQFALELENLAFVGASSAFCEMLGYPKDQIESKRLSHIDRTNDVSTKADCDKFVEFIQRAGRNYQQRVSYRHIDGSLRDCLVVYELGGNSNRRVLTGYVKAASNTQKSKWQSRFERTLTALPYGIVELDLEDNILYADQKMADLLGHDADSLSGHNITDFHVSETDKKNSIRSIDLRRKGLSGSYRRQFKKSNGSIIWMLVQAMPLFEGNEVTGVLGFHTELSHLATATPAGFHSFTEALIDPVEHLRFAALIQGQENERVRIAKEIHDGLGQSLTAIIRKLNHNIRHEDNDKHKSGLEEIKAYMSDVLAEARAMSQNLAPTVLEDFGVAEAILNVVEGMTNSEVRVTFRQRGLLGKRFEKNIENNFFRIAQEAISNALQHSNGSQVDVQLTYNETNLSLNVTDNGQGIKSSVDLANSMGQGLSNIQARANLIKAKVAIEDSTNGVTVRLDKALQTRKHAQNLEKEANHLTYIA